MKAALALFTIVICANAATAAAPASVQGRHLADLHVVPTRVLQRSISPWFYRSVLASPLEGWITVQARLSGAELHDPRIVRSDLGGEFDALALKLTGGLKIAGDSRIGSLIPNTRVLFHLMIYRIADGTMALSCVCLDNPGGTQLDYFGCAKLMVLKDDGKLIELKGPESLQDKGFVILPPRALDIANARTLSRVGAQ